MGGGGNGDVAEESAPVVAEQQGSQDAAEQRVVEEGEAAKAAANGGPGAPQDLEYDDDDGILADEDDGEEQQLKSGTVLEGAFVDPAYSWPPPDGVGKNAVELQASTALLSHVQSKDEEDGDDPTLETSPSAVSAQVRGSKVQTTETVTTSRCGFLHCCKNTEEQVVTKSYDDLTDEEKRMLRASVKSGKSAKKLSKKERAKLARAQEKARRRAERDREKYSRVPEGVLVYRLDTAAHTVSLVSQPHAKTDEEALLRHMVIAGAAPSQDRSRRGVVLTGVDGTWVTLVACEQRTAIAWLEAIEMMLGNQGRGRRLFGRKNPNSRAWAAEKLGDDERNKIEDDYLNLTAYSNNLIRAGALPGHEGKKREKGKVDKSGIYYSVQKHHEEGDDVEDEALESIAKRRAVIKDSWDFYRMICSLLRDKRKYDEVFRKMTHDPVFPYLNSMTGLNDPGDAGYENTEKTVVQRDLPAYSSMTRTQVVQDLVAKAEEALPSLVEICKALAGSLGMEEVGVGPVKEVSAAIRKSEKKYEGDVLKVTDYCRALLVVKDFPTLLALLELARDSFGPLIRRVKLSSLKTDHRSMPGGYRDCKINLELKEHICEIQVHLWPMWVVCGIDGFRHYRHCLEYSTDSFEDPYESLDGLDRKTVAELIVMAEEAVSEMPLDSLEWYHEKYILDYFAEAGLFLRHGLEPWAETTLRELIRLRCESPDLGPAHHETRFLKRYLIQALQQQGKNDEAAEIAKELDEYDKAEKKEKRAAVDKNMSIFNVCGNPAEALEGIMDPNKEEREEEEKLKKEVKASKKAWRKIREQRFKFLDASSGMEERKRSSGQDQLSANY